MSIVAFDWGTLAIDKMSSNGNRKSHIKKWKRLEDGTILTWVGRQDQGLCLASWYIDGCDKFMWPKFQENDETRSTLIVMKPGKSIGAFESQPFMIEENREEEFYAWGSGDDIAIGAMAMGASARQAVEVASRYNIYCGLGVDEFDFISGSEVKRGKNDGTL